MIEIKMPRARSKLDNSQAAAKNLRVLGALRMLWKSFATPGTRMHRTF